MAVVAASPITRMRSEAVVRTTTKRAAARAAISTPVSIPQSRNGCERPVNSSARPPSITSAKIAATATSVGASSSVVLSRTN